MKKGKKNSIKPFYPQIREMHEKGMKANDIGLALGVRKQSILNALSIMGLSTPRIKLELQGLTFADNSPPVLETFVIDGKKYTDVTPLFSPR